eukprot:4985099-Amphidinium_carterae.1
MSEAALLSAGEQGDMLREASDASCCAASLRVSREPSRQVKDSMEFLSRLCRGFSCKDSSRHCQADFLSCTKKKTTCTMRQTLHMCARSS